MARYFETQLQPTDERFNPKTNLATSPLELAKSLKLFEKGLLKKSKEFAAWRTHM